MLVMKIESTNVGNNNDARLIYHHPQVICKLNFSSSKLSGCQQEQIQHVFNSWVWYIMLTSKDIWFKSFYWLLVPRNDINIAKANYIWLFLNVCRFRNPAFKWIHLSGSGNVLCFGVYRIILQYMMVGRSSLSFCNMPFLWRNWKKPSPQKAARFYFSQCIFLLFLIPFVFFIIETYK